MWLQDILKTFTGLALGVGLSGGLPSRAIAHPDVWVTVQYQVSFSEAGLTELNLIWTYDVFYSSRAFNRHDLDRDGAFSQEESRALQEAVFDPLAENGYFVRFSQGDTAKNLRLTRFEPMVAGDRLAVGFTLVPDDPVAYREAEVAMTTFDDKVFEFSLAEEDFLTVTGAFDQTCRFRVQAGAGPLEGMPQTIALICPN